MKKLYKPNFKITSIDHSNEKYDKIKTEGADSNELMTRKLKDNDLMFIVPKGADLFDIEDPLFNLSVFLKKYTTNSIEEINREIEQNTAIKDVPIELVDGEYYIPAHTFFSVKDDFTKKGLETRNLNYLSSQPTLISLNGHNGSAFFSAGKVVFEADGSGQVANGNIMWDAIGNLLIRGWFESNNEGNRIIIDPKTRQIQLISENGKIAGLWYFNELGSSIIKVNDVTISQRGINNNESQYPYKFSLSDQGINCKQFDDDYNTLREFSAEMNAFSDHLDVRMIGLPTSSAGLPVGALYRSGDTIKIKL